jgi:hypothetical protein
MMINHFIYLRVSEWKTYSCVDRQTSYAKMMNKAYKWIKRHISYYVACGVITLSIPALVNASETDLKRLKKSDCAEAEIDSL